MIQVYHNKRKGIWYGVAIKDNQILATYFSTEEPDVRSILGRLLEEASF